MLNKNNAGLSVGSILVGLMLLGVVVQSMISMMTNTSDIYQRNLNSSKLVKYKSISDNSTKATEDFKNKFTEATAGSSLSLTSLPGLAWSATLILYNSINSAPSIVSGLVEDASSDLEISNDNDSNGGVGTVLTLAFTVSLLLVILGAVLRSEFI